MFEFNFKGYLACNNPYYYSSDYPIDVTVIAENESEALKKADSIVGYIHRRTLRCQSKEITNFKHEYSETYIKGASDFLEFIEQNNDKTPLCKLEMRTLLNDFIQQFNSKK